MGNSEKKVCNTCKIEKPIEEFYNDKSRKSGKMVRCKRCDAIAYKKRNIKRSEKRSLSSRKSHLKIKYGITQKEYELLLAKQGNKCGICGTYENKTINRVSHFAVDHCHSTGKIRGLLCNRCNRGLGMLGDTMERLEAALRYLKSETH